MAVEGCEFERVFRGLHSTIHSKFWIFGDFRIETCSGISSSVRMCLWSCQLDAANLWYFNLCWKFVCICMIVDSLTKRCYRRYLSLECLDWFLYPRAERKSENREHQKYRVSSRKLVTREKTKPQPPTVISFCFHVAFDWLLHDGNCQNQSFYSQRAWIGYNIDVTVENRFGRIILFRICMEVRFLTTVTRGSYFSPLRFNRSLLAKEK